MVYRNDGNFRCHMSQMEVEFHPFIQFNTWLRWLVQSPFHPRKGSALVKRSGWTLEFAECGDGKKNMWCPCSEWNPAIHSVDCHFTGWTFMASLVIVYNFALGLHYYWDFLLWFNFSMFVMTCLKWIYNIFMAYLKCYWKQ
jgi:hypothetical protein